MLPNLVTLLRCHFKIRNDDKCLIVLNLQKMCLTKNALVLSNAIK